MLPEQQQRILGYFIEEARDHLNTIEQGLLNLESTLNDPEMINEVFRAAHSIKGGAAMLGLTSIQHTSHRLEDCFKILKDNPIQVDQKLESLFLGVSDTLKALLEQLSGPFGLSEEVANTLMSETEPVFQWLHEHLEQLVQKGGTAEIGDHTVSKPNTADSVVTFTGIFFGQDVATPAEVTPKTSPVLPTYSPVVATDSDQWSEFQSQVLQTLREMLQIFKQPATSASRQKLQDCCNQLVKLGKTWNLPNWCNLCKAAANAIANQENTYLTLAKIVITEIKQAQELVLRSRESEITISHRLEALWGFPEMPLLEVAQNLLGDVPTAISQSFITPITPTPEPTITNKEIRAPLIESPKDSVTSLTEISEQLAPQSVIAENIAHKDIPFDHHDQTTYTTNKTHTHGPEVGLAELNTLADLFEGETPEFDETWQQEEIIDINNTSNLGVDASESTGEEVDSDIADFLSLEEDKEETENTINNTEDLSLLFGENFLEKNNLESLDLFKAPVTAGEIIQEARDNTNQLPDSNDVIDDLLALKINDKIQAGNELEQTKVSSNFDDLFLDTDINVVGLEDTKLPTNSEPQLITLSEDLSLNNLFNDLEENTELSTDKSEISDLFDLPPATTLEFAPTVDNLADLWNSETEVEPEQILESAIEEDIAQALEESLFEAAASGDIFVENRQFTSPLNESLDPDDLNITFLQDEQQLDLLFASDTGDDLFEELTANTHDTHGINIISDDIQFLRESSEVSSPEIHDFSQQPEVLDFIPEFTTQIQELSPVDESEVDLFSEINENNHSLVIESRETSDNNDLFTTASVLDVQQSVEKTNDSSGLETGIDFSAPAVAETNELDLDDDLSALTSDLTDITFDETDDSSRLETVAETSELELDDDLSELTLDELIAETHNFTDIPVEDITLSTSESSELELALTNDENPEDIADSSGLLVDITPATKDVAEFEVENVASTEVDIPESVKSDTYIQDDFADLEALLEIEEATSSADNDSIAGDDFAALEALLGEDSPETVLDEPPAVAKIIKTPPPVSVTPAPLGDEFSDLEKLLAEADQTISHSSPVKPTVGKTPRTSNRRTARFEETMKVPVKQLDEMSNLVGELVVNRNTLEQDHERLRQSLDNLLVQVQQLSDVGARMQELYERSLLEASLLASRKTREPVYEVPDANSDRGFSELEMDRFTPFHTLSQEMIELIVRVRESASDIDFVTEETERVARQFRQVTTQLQEGLTRARMVPFSQTIDRLRRGVRDNAIKFGKQVELLIEGGDTLIDKMILDHLNDPLTHMLNNAIAHGIETPEIREAAGKPPVGTITIRAFHQGNQTVISVGDDGAGIDPERIKAKAVKLGIMTLEQARTISRLEIYDLLFQSGFSTKDEADEIAGRGVGMDVVRSEISEIRGAVNTDSTVGKGTTFTIRLPLTLSICKALCCVSDKARIAFSMDGVEDTLDIPSKNVQHNPDGQSFISWRDTVLPFRPLKDLLTFNRQLGRGNVYGGTRDDDMISVVVVRSGNTLIALQIDQVLSEQEIVIKQFEGPAPKPIGVAGATVLGDGRIMPIADVLEIIDIFQGRMSKHAGGAPWQQTPPIAIEVPAVKIDPTVLIVDDSITVRELLSLTFNKAGYRVEQARDGQEAWDKLRSGLPCDIVFCDIEMPRCDGLELLSRIQKDSTLNHLPIAMLTSRGADKHRQMAIQLGASGYFTKPYLEEALLEAAVRMLKGEKLVSHGNA